MALRGLQSFEEAVVRGWMGWSTFRRITIGSFAVVLAGILLIVFGLVVVILGAWLGIFHIYDR